MKGKHHIIIESARLKYEFDIKRNITIIQGDSATGKTTLIDLLSDYQNDRINSPVRIESDVPCEVFAGAGDRWMAVLELITDSIVFIDEENHFIRQKEFAEVVRNSSNYFVLITRETLPVLPYSIHEIYGIRTSGRYHFPEKIYHELYPIYDDVLNHVPESDTGMIMITEDTDSGNQFFSSFFHDPENCIGAGGDEPTTAATITQSAHTVKRGKTTTVKISSDSGAKLHVSRKNKLAGKKKYVKITNGKTAKIVFRKNAPKGKYTFKVTSPVRGQYKKQPKP